METHPMRIVGALLLDEILPHFISQEKIDRYKLAARAKDKALAKWRKEKNDDE